MTNTIPKALKRVFVSNYYISSKKSKKIIQKSKKANFTIDRLVLYVFMKNIEYRSNVQSFFVFYNIDNIFLLQMQSHKANDH